MFDKIWNADIYFSLMLSGAVAEHVFHHHTWPSHCHKSAFKHTGGKSGPFLLVLMAAWMPTRAGKRYRGRGGRERMEWDGEGLNRDGEGGSGLGQGWICGSSMRYTLSSFPGLLHWYG